MMRDPARAPRRAGSGFALANGGRAFRHRNYRLFFGGQLVSLVGTWMQQVAQALARPRAHQRPAHPRPGRRRSPFLPVLVLGLFGGLIADALPKRQTLIVTQAVQMTLAFILFALVVTDTRRRCGRSSCWPRSSASRTPSTCPPARRSPSRWSGARTSPTPSRSTRRSSTGRASSGPRSPASRSAFFGGDVSAAFLINGLSFLAVIIALRRDARERPQPPRRLRPPGVARGGPHEPRATGCATSGATRWC